MLIYTIIQNNFIRGIYVPQIFLIYVIFYTYHETLQELVSPYAVIEKIMLRPLSVQICWQFTSSGGLQFLLLFTTGFAMIPQPMQIIVA